MSETINFSHNFKHTDWDEWKAEAIQTLKGGQFDDKLVRVSEDGLKLGPLFSMDHRGEAAFLAKTPSDKLDGRPWHIDALIDNPNLKTANTDALADLTGGASAITLCIDASGGSGIALRSLSDVSRILAGVETDLVPISLSPHRNIALTALACAALPKEAAVSLGLSSDTPQAKHALAWAATHAPKWKVLSINARALHEGGATPMQELAGMAALLSAAARAYGEDVFKSLDIHLASEANAQQGLVKIRAAKAIINTITKAYGQQHVNIPIKVTTPMRMLSKIDPWSNMLRLSSAVFAGVTGGANHVTCLPFTNPIGPATPFARRMARNIQLIYMDESHLGQVNDPAHGSYAFESLTQNLAQAAWTRFQAMEAAGGWTHQAVQTQLKSEIRRAHKTRTKHLKDNSAPMVGVNQYVKPDVRKADVLKRPNIAARKGKIARSGKFSGLISRFKDGALIPNDPPKFWIKPVRSSQTFENGEVS